MNVLCLCGRFQNTAEFRGHVANDEFMHVIPADAGIQFAVAESGCCRSKIKMDSGVRRNDGCVHLKSTRDVLCFESGGFGRDLLATVVEWKFGYQSAFE